MIDKELVKRYIVEFRKRDFSDVKRRELKVEFIKGKAICIVGPRRVGKTYFLYSLMMNLENQLYVDFEHPVFYNVSPRDIIHIIDSYFELYPERKNLYVFLDEVQAVEDWERIVRYLLDRGFYVAVTGSSSRLMSHEIATHLRGRSITYYLLTLSFREALNFKNIEHKGENFYLNYSKIKGLISEYLKYGGYPEVILYDVKERVLKEYLNLIIRRDIIERYNIRNKHLINELIYFAINNYSRYISYDSLLKLFKQRLNVTKRTIINYLSYFEDSMLFFFLRRFEPSIKSRIVSPRKIYLIDTGFGIFGNKSISRDMENAVFLELLRRKYYFNPLCEIYYFKDSQGHEVDFVVKEGDKVKECINVTYASGFDEIDKRDWRSLLKAREVLGCSKLTIVTWDYEDKKELSWFGRRGEISFVPLWKWLLQIPSKERRRY